eukprot:m.644005 g.644005  ORF g.644005 m.644005 type:complete len:375 (-) comp22646_c0_seq13:188-1312(-)
MPPKRPMPADKMPFAFAAAPPCGPSSWSLTARRSGCSVTDVSSTSATICCTRGSYSNVESLRRDLRSLDRLECSTLSRSNTFVAAALPLSSCPFAWPRVVFSASRNRASTVCSIDSFSWSILGNPRPYTTDRSSKISCALKRVLACASVDSFSSLPPSPWPLRRGTGTRSIKCSTRPAPSLSAAVAMMTFSAETRRSRLALHVGWSTSASTAMVWSSGNGPCDTDGCAESTSPRGSWNALMNDCSWSYETLPIFAFSCKGIFRCDAASRSTLRTSFRASLSRIRTRVRKSCDASAQSGCTRFAAMALRDDARKGTATSRSAEATGDPGTRRHVFSAVSSILSFRLDAGPTISSARSTTITWACFELFLRAAAAS